MGEVHQRDGAAGKNEGEAIGAHQAIVGGLGTRAGGEFRAPGLARLVDAFEHHHLSAVDRTVGMLAAGETRLEGERGIPVASTKPAAESLTSPYRVERSSARTRAPSRVTARKIAPSSTVTSALRTASSTQRDSATSSYITTVVFDGPPRR